MLSIHRHDALDHPPKDGAQLETVTFDAGCSLGYDFNNYSWDFGCAGCTASGVARVAQHTGAAVVPAFTIWDPVLRKYRVEFDPALELICTGDDEADAVANTAMFTKVIEGYVRRYPDQWLWVHRRWKTRPTGEAPLY